MANAFDLTCPECGSSEIDILASVWIRLTEDGTDADLSHDGDHTWSDRSRFICDDCDHEGRVSQLKEEAG